MISVLAQGLHSKDSKSTRDKANISSPKVNRGCPPLTARRPVAGSLISSLFCARINGSVNNGEPGDLRRYRAHYDVTVIVLCDDQVCIMSRQQDLENSLRDDFTFTPSQWENQPCVCQRGIQLFIDTDRITGFARLVHIYHIDNNVCARVTNCFSSHERVTFVFISRVARVHALFYFLHDITNPEMTMKTTIFTHRPRVSLALSFFCWWRHNRLLMGSQ